MRFKALPVTSLEDVTLDLEQLQGRAILDKSATNFLQLVASGTVAANWGTGTVTWTASQTSAVSNIAHGLTRAPVWVGFFPLDNFTLRQNGASDATNFHVSGWYLSGSVTGTGSFQWLAIG